jgi:hypothetical protein
VSVIERHGLPDHRRKLSNLAKSPYVVRMNRPLTSLERAFELARSGTCLGISDLRRKLRAEGFSDLQLEGRTLTRQLVDLCTSARVGRSA